MKTASRIFDWVLDTWEFALWYVPLYAAMLGIIALVGELKNDGVPSSDSNELPNAINNQPVTWAPKPLEERKDTILPDHNFKIPKSHGTKFHR